MKKKKINKNFIHTLAATLLSVCFLASCCVVFGLFYRLNDDVLIRDFISGIYSGTPDGHTTYMLYPFAAAVAGLYRLLPFVPWYGMVMVFLQTLCLALCAKRLLDLQNTRTEKVLSGAAVFLFGTAFLARDFVFIHYTVTGGLLMTTACFLFITGSEKRSDKEFIKANIVPILLAFLSFCIRPQIGLFLLPLLACCGLLRYFTEQKMGTGHRMFWKRYVPVFLIAVLMMCAAFLGDRLAYRSEQWKTYRTFNTIRTELYDYNTIPGYEVHAAFYNAAGIDKTQVKLLENYNYMLDERIDSGLITKINDYNAAGKDSLAGRLKLTLWLYVHRAFDKTDAPLNYIVLAFYALSFLALLGAKKARTMLCLIGTGAIRSALWMFLLFRGRMADRITEPLLLTEMLLLIGLLLYVVRMKKWDIKVPLLVVSCVLLLLGSIAGLPKVSKDAKEYKANAAEWMMLQKSLWENDDNYYLLDVYSTVKYSERVFDEPTILVHKLAMTDKGKHVGRNNEIAGGWCAFSPIMYEKQSAYGIANAADSLLTDDHVFFVAKASSDVSWLPAYYASRGIPVTLTDVTFYGDFVVYKIAKKK